MYKKYKASTINKNLNKKQVAQELLCDFQASGETFLSSEDIEKLRMQTKTPLEKWGPANDVWVWKYALDGHSYIISADVSRGDGNDYSTFHVIDTTESEVVAEFRGKVPPDQFAYLLVEAAKRYSKKNQDKYKEKYEIKLKTDTGSTIDHNKKVNSIEKNKEMIS